MKKHYLLHTLAFCFLLTACGIQQSFQRGTTQPAEFYTQLTFLNPRNIVVVPCELNGVTKNFYFDTGATVSNIQRDSIIGKRITVRGGSNRTEENGTEIVKSIKIGDVDFVNTFASNSKMAYLKENIPNFGGVLGRSLINKANWLIDYPNKTLTISNRNLGGEGFSKISISDKDEAPYTTLTVGGTPYKAILDLGSVSIFNIPKGTPLADYLIANFDTKEVSRERYTVGGNETIKELVGQIPQIKVGDVVFENIDFNINMSSQIRLGMSFFTKSMVYIDGKQNEYWVKK